MNKAMDRAPDYLARLQKRFEWPVFEGAADSEVFLASSLISTKWLAPGRNVRGAIHELDGTMPENLPVAESIKKVASREKKRFKAEPKKSMANDPGTKLELGQSRAGPICFHLAETALIATMRARFHRDGQISQDRRGRFRRGD